MIKLKRLNGKEFVVNCEFIEFIESTPDTVITLMSGNKLVVSDTVDEVIQRVVEYKRSINSQIKIIRQETESLETFSER